MESHLCEILGCGGSKVFWEAEEFRETSRIREMVTRLHYNVYIYVIKKNSIRIIVYQIYITVQVSGGASNSHFNSDRAFFDAPRTGQTHGVEINREYTWKNSHID